MARLLTWTGMGNGDRSLLRAQFDGLVSGYSEDQMPYITYVSDWGEYALNSGGINGPATKIYLGSSKSEIYMGFKVKSVGMDNGNRLIAVCSGTTTLGSIVGWNTGTACVPFPRLACCRGDASTWLAAGGIFERIPSTYFIEFYYKPDPTNGRWIMKQNGRTVVDYTGNTVPGSQTTLDYIIIGTLNGISSSDFYVTNIVIDDANWPGVSKFDHLVVNGSGNAAQWSPSTSPNDGCVDETPPSFSDYNSTNTADQIDSFATENLNSLADKVKSVSIHVFGVKESSPTPTQAKALVRTGGTDYVGDGKTIGTYITEARKVWQQNPNTAADWTPTEVNGMEIGYKSAA